MLENPLLYCSNRKLLVDNTDITSHNYKNCKMTPQTKSPSHNVITCECTELVIPTNINDEQQVMVTIVSPQKS